MTVVLLLSERLTRRNINYCFSVETKLHHRPLASSNQSIKVQLRAISDPKETLDCLKVFDSVLLNC